MSDRVRIVEMSPRDGLQNESRIIATADKIKLIDLLSECGFEKIEAASFVNPKWVPQMADGAAVMAGISRRDHVAYAALTPNLKGYEAARAAGVDEVAVFTAASEGFSQKNINCSIAESLARFRPVIAAAQSDDVPVRGYVSCAVVCPYDGAAAPENVARVTHALLEMGCFEVSLGDTIGHGAPETVGRMLEAVLKVAPTDRLAGHFHDTKNRALENIELSLRYGLRVFDASVGGLGGCPYAPGAKGNVDTAAVARLLEAKGFETGLAADRLAMASAFATGLRSG